MIECPRCKTQNLVSYGERTTGGWLSIIIGIMLLPIGIGIIFILYGLFATERKYRCKDCRKIF